MRSSFWLLVFFVGLLSLQALAAAADVPADKPARPNFVIIFCDDLGYGDLGCFGHPTIRTPALDRMASEGMKLTQFYSSAPVCSASRAALLTGRLPIRTGINGVLGPRSQGGIQPSEITLAAALKPHGYATACVGKWHLGHLPQYLPTRHGFDRYFGIPYSNDMKPTPLIENERQIEEPAVLETITERYTSESLKFIRENRERPFLLYLAHTFPHVPLAAAARAKSNSPRGLYGDVVAQIDHSTSQILATLKELNLDEKTLVLFTSDNGPWLIKKQEAGSAGLLRDGKGTTWEGGMREPCIVRWPGKIAPGGVSPALASTLDVFATCLSLAGIPLPADRKLDSNDLSPVLLKQSESPRKMFFYYRDVNLMAIRKGPWKLHIKTAGFENSSPMAANLLYQLDNDPSERYDRAADEPTIVSDLLAEIERHRAEVEPGALQR